MSDQSIEPRRPILITLLALVAAPAFAMWYLGRGWLGIAYVVGAIAWGFAALALFSSGLVSFPDVDGLAAVDWLQLSVYVPVALIGIVHALMIRRHALARPWFSRWSGLLLVFVGLLLCGLAVRSFWMQPFSIPSGSMAPTLKVGDYLFANKSTYGYGPYSIDLGIGPILWDEADSRAKRKVPKRGDIVIFRLPTNTRVDYIKRVIGLPGDRVQLRDGRLILNGVAVDTQPAGFANQPSYDGRERKIPQLRETLPSGRSYFVLDQRQSGFPDTTDVYVVPEGHFFVLGDNRDNSTDSRFQQDVGFIPLENLVGEATLIFASRHPERILTWVK